MFWFCSSSCCLHLFAIQKPSCCSLNVAEKLRRNVEQRPQVERSYTLRVDARTQVLRVVRDCTHRQVVRMSYMAQPAGTSTRLGFAEQIFYNSRER